MKPLLDLIGEPEPVSVNVTWWSKFKCMVVMWWSRITRRTQKLTIEVNDEEIVGIG